MPKKSTLRQQRYDLNNTKRYGLKLNLNTDADIIDRFSHVPSVQGYVKQLVRDDIRKSRVPVPHDQSTGT